MAELLYSLDVEVFYFINNTWSNSLFDRFFPYITNPDHWFLVYIIFWFMAYIKGGRIGKIAAIGSIFLITASDQFSSFILKDFFARARPCNVLPDVNILVHCTGSYSMPSSHAVNNFAAAFYFGRIFPNTKKLLIVIATVVALSRPYVGVHYPSDILVGAFVGAGIGYLFSYGVIKLDEYLAEHPLKFRKKSE